MEAEQARGRVKMVPPPLEELGAREAMTLRHPGGYGTESHGHLGLSHRNGHTAPAPAVPAAALAPEPAPG